MKLVCAFDKLDMDEYECAGAHVRVQSTINWNHITQLLAFFHLTSSSQNSWIIVLSRLLICTVSICAALLCVTFFCCIAEWNHFVPFHIVSNHLKQQIIDENLHKMCIKKLAQDRLKNSKSKCSKLFLWNLIWKKNRQITLCKWIYCKALYSSNTVHHWYSVGLETFDDFFSIWSLGEKCYCTRKCSAEDMPTDGFFVINIFSVSQMIWHCLNKS